MEEDKPNPDTVEEDARMYHGYIGLCRAKHTRTVGQRSESLGRGSDELWLQKHEAFVAR